MADQSRSIRRELFKSAFKNFPPDKDETSEYLEVKGPHKCVSGNSNSMEANNGKYYTRERKDTNNVQNMHTP